MEVVRTLAQRLRVSGFPLLWDPGGRRNSGPPLGLQDLGTEFIERSFLSLQGPSGRKGFGDGWGHRSWETKQKDRVPTAHEDPQGYPSPLSGSVLSPLRVERRHLSRSSQSSPPHWSRNSSVFMPPTRSKSDL